MTAPNPRPGAVDRVAAYLGALADQPHRGGDAIDVVDGVPLSPADVRALLDVAARHVPPDPPDVDRAPRVTEAAELADEALARYRRPVGPRLADVVAVELTGRVVATDLRAGVPRVLVALDDGGHVWAGADRVTVAGSADDAPAPGPRSAT